ncbi:BAH_G0052030.mRNA.1.CDS.1 [Saccharomyces cerevisiae]|nr:BAH_G0052030.mRNA.1.CDS.1 [Saccharomyces cerevisiae]CAI7341266.1 BAH_G0052030.mRNA.1.CDS.1 [Saccharomyces cerevisiae]
MNFETKIPPSTRRSRGSRPQMKSTPATIKYSLHLLDTGALFDYPKAKKSARYCIQDIANGGCDRCHLSWTAPFGRINRYQNNKTIN